MTEPAPRLSVIVVSFSDRLTLERCVTALAADLGGVSAEVLVVRRSPDVESLRSRFPAVVWVAAPKGETVPRMRSIGLRACRGELVALLEDDCIVVEGWSAALLAAHEGPVAAVGGPVEPDEYPHSRDWGVFFAEYGRFMAPFAGDVTVLPGNNVSYKRSALNRVGAAVNDPRGFYETFVNGQLLGAGEVLTAAAAMVVHNVNSWPREWLTMLPYYHGRAFGALRLAGRPAAVRIAYAALAPVTAAIKIARHARDVARRGRRIPDFGRALPWIVLFECSWCAGEAVGYVLGPGESLQHWR